MQWAYRLAPEDLHHVICPRDRISTSGMSLAQNAQNDSGNYLIVLVMAFSCTFFMRLLEMQRRTLQYSTISARIIVKDDHDGSTCHALIIDVGEVTTKELLYWAHILIFGISAKSMAFSSRQSPPSQSSLHCLCIALSGQSFSFLNCALTRQLFRR